MRDGLKKKLAHAHKEIQHVENGLAHVAEDIGHEAGRKVSDVEGKVKQAIGSEDSTSRQSRPGTAGTVEASDHSPEEEEGWMSDREVDADSTTGKKNKTKKPSKLIVSRPLSASSSRRRSSFRRGVFTAGHSKQSASDGQIIVSLASEDDDNEDRRGRRSTPRGDGRPTTPTTPSLLAPSSHRSVRHRRIDSLRSNRPESRELSPSRSIRWADEQDMSGTMTPKFLSPSSPSTPLPGSEAPSDDDEPEIIIPHKADDSPTSATQVRFDIPPTKDR